MKDSTFFIYSHPSLIGVTFDVTNVVAVHVTGVAGTDGEDAWLLEDVAMEENQKIIYGLYIIILVSYNRYITHVCQSYFYLLTMLSPKSLIK